MSVAAIREVFEPVKLAVSGWAHNPLPQIHLGYRAFRQAHGLIKAANDT